MTELEFLKRKGLIKEGFTQFVISGDFGKIELTELLREFKNEEIEHMKHDAHNGLPNSCVDGHE